MSEPKFLQDVDPQHAFIFRNGVVVRNIYELLNELHHISDTDFEFHVSRGVNDFAMWISNVLGEKSLELHKELSRERMIAKIKKHIKQTEEKLMQPPVSKSGLEKNWKIGTPWGQVVYLLCFGILVGILGTSIFYGAQESTSLSTQASITGIN